MFNITFYNKARHSTDLPAALPLLYKKTELLRLKHKTMKTRAEKLTTGYFTYYQLLTIVIFVISLTGFSFISKAQVYKAVTSSLKVEGTSNLHDWVMETQNVPAEAQLAFKGDQLQDITSLTLSLPVKNLKAKEDLMNTRAYKAMKADQYNKVTFKLASGSVTPLQGDQYTVKATGTLTIAGVPKEVALQAKAVTNADGTVTFTGSRKIKMSEYGINPPSFMFGALKVADEVTIDFNLKLKK